jgi:5-methylcytosine-specific restriction protein A
MPTLPPTHRTAAARQARQHERRGSATRRGYGTDWQKCRAAYLRCYPLCHDCRALGRVTPAAEVHHTKRLREHPESRLDWSTLLPLCRSCHSKRTAKGE